MSSCITDGFEEARQKSKILGEHADPDVLWVGMSESKTLSNYNMKKQKLKLAILVGAMGLAAQSQAALYDLTFTGGTLTAIGQIDVSGGVADSGYLDVLSGPNAGNYSLVGLNSPLINANVTPTFSTVRLHGADDQIFDDIVYAGSNPFLTGNGLEFANNDNIGFNLWANGANSYSLFDSAPGVYLVDGGTASLVATVPEPAATARLAGIASLGALLITLRKKLPAAV